MIAKLRKGQKNSKNLKTIANFNKIQDKKIFKNILLSPETIQYPYFRLKNVSLGHWDPYTWNMIKIFRKFEKIKFYQKIAKAGVIEILIPIPLTLETMK